MAWKRSLRRVEGQKSSVCIFFHLLLPSPGYRSYRVQSRQLSVLFWDWAPAGPNFPTGPLGLITLQLEQMTCKALVDTSF